MGDATELAACVQQGSTRKRKDANIADIKVAVHLFAFDCLYYNGRSLLSEPLEERRSILHSALKETDDELSFAVSKVRFLVVLRHCARLLGPTARR